MQITEAVVGYDGHGITSRVSRISGNAMTVIAEMSPAPNEEVTGFIDGVGKLDARVRAAKSSRIELALMTDTRERWQRLQKLRQHSAENPIIG